MTPDRPVHLPSIEGLRAVEATARLCSFEKAALELNLTPSAVSKRVITLERLTGVPLFHRRANSLTLSEAGATYVTQAREVLRMLGTMHQDLGSTRPQRLKVTATPTFARQILAPNLPSFATYAPGIDLDLIVVAPLLDAPRTGADVEIRHGQGMVANALPLLHDVVTPMASPDYLRSAPPTHAPVDICRLTWLRTPLEPWAPWLHMARIAVDEPEGGPKFSDLGLVYEAAVNGQGVTLCRPSLVGDWMARKALQPLFNIYAKPAGTYYLLPRSHGEATEAFVQWLQSLCHQLAARNLDIACSFFRTPPG
jgi:LysR family glycine cleavage system transcriptional activator